MAVYVLAIYIAIVLVNKIRHNIKTWKLSKEYSKVIWKENVKNAVVVWISRAVLIGIIALWLLT